MAGCHGACRQARRDAQPAPQQRALGAAPPPRCRRAAVITFNDDVKTVGPSQKADFPLARVLREQPSGTTALYDAVLQGLSTGLQVHRRLMDGQQLNVRGDGI